jgi:hypothetical protein
MTDRAEVDDIVSMFRTLEVNARASSRLARSYSAYELMAFKGIHLAHVLARHPLDRPSGDADLWVARGDYRRLLREIACDRRWSIETSSPLAAVVRDEDGARIDLQRYPWFPPFHRRERALLVGAASRPLGLGGQLLAPHVVDAAVIALAHYVKDALYGEARVISDLSLLEERGADPARVGARLRELGLFRCGLAGITALARGADELVRWVDAFSPSRAELVRADRDREALTGLETGDAGFLIVPALLRDRSVERAEALAIGLLREVRLRLRRARRAV